MGRRIIKFIAWEKNNEYKYTESNTPVVGDAIYIKLNNKATISTDIVTQVLNETSIVINSETYVRNSSQDFSEISWVVDSEDDEDDFDDEEEQKNKILINLLIDNDGKILMLNNKALAYILPDAYAKVDYIASTGTQYIDTNVIPRSNTLIYEWEGRDDDPSGNTSLFSSEYAVGGVYSNRDFGGVMHGNNTRRNIYVGKTTGMSIGYSSTDGLFHRWSLNINSDHKVYLTKDGTKLTDYNWTGEVNKYNTIALFCNHTTNSFSQYAKVAYRYFKIRDEVGLLFYGIPVRRNSDQVLGMYDLVTKTFFVNKGTGSFVTE